VQGGGDSDSIAVDAGYLQYFPSAARRVTGARVIAVPVALAAFNEMDIIPWVNTQT